MYNKIKKNLFTLLSTFFFLYFFFSLFGGERGFISYKEKKDFYEKLISNKKQIQIKIDELEHKNSLLTENIDLDFIEILIRDKFLFGKEDETTYIIK
tara:strand:- start:227 stop:517 length:291 start_codon:yes stop_codon:yes gene_type:complete